jgi:hypothetical protein
MMELENMRSEALAIDAEAAPAPAPAPEAAPEGPPPVDLAAEIGAIVTMVTSMLSPVFPSLRAIYTPEAVGAASGAVAAVCNKHGWMQGGMMGEWGEEIACAAVCLPLALATYRGISSDIAAREAKPEKVAAGVDLSAKPPEEVPEYPATVTAGTVQ